jgi:uncharacterized membrane protein (UPF0127 family)
MKDVLPFGKPPRARKCERDPALGKVDALHQRTNAMIHALQLRQARVLWLCLGTAMLWPGSSATAEDLPTTTVEIGSASFRVEVASNDAQRMRGLMFRESLPDDQGMLFVFEQELPLSFWMKNTRIPLDMLYFDGQARLVSIQRNVPPCVTAYCPSYAAEGPSRFVLELNGNRSEALGLERGAPICERSGSPLTPLPRCP